MATVGYNKSAWKKSPADINDRTFVTVVSTTNWIRKCWVMSSDFLGVQVISKTINGGVNMTSLKA